MLASCAPFSRSAFFPPSSKIGSSPSLLFFLLCIYSSFYFSVFMNIYFFFSSYAFFHFLVVLFPLPLLFASLPLPPSFPNPTTPTTTSPSSSSPTSLSCPFFSPPPFLLVIHSLISPPSLLPSPTPFPQPPSIASYFPSLFPPLPTNPTSTTSLYLLTPTLFPLLHFPLPLFPFFPTSSSPISCSPSFFSSNPSSPTAPPPPRFHSVLLLLLNLPSPTSSPTRDPTSPSNSPSLPNLHPSFPPPPWTAAPYITRNQRPAGEHILTAAAPPPPQLLTSGPEFCSLSFPFFTLSLSFLLLPSPPVPFPPVPPSLFPCPSAPTLSPPPWSRCLHRSMSWLTCQRPNLCLGGSGREAWGSGKGIG